MTKLILAIHDTGRSYSKMYKKYFDGITEDVTLLFTNPEKIGLISFTGGEDVSPSLYGESNSHSFCNPARDDYETRIFKEALKHKIPMAGICRGSQFLNVMCGGRMIQHITGHAGVQHNAATYDGDILVTSTHHQMSVLGDGGILLASAVPKLSDVYINGENRSEDQPIETEAFVYPDYNVIGWQFHPEFVVDIKDKSDPIYSCVEFTWRSFEKYILNGGKDVRKAFA